MSGFVPRTPGGGDERSDRPETTLQGIRSHAEILGRWQVRAAQFRALELARETFGEDTRGSMVSVRHRGDIRGLMRLDVPFQDLEAHRTREGTFMARAAADPLLASVPLVYVMEAGRE